MALGVSGKDSVISWGTPSVKPQGSHQPIFYTDLPLWPVGHPYSWPYFFSHALQAILIRIVSPQLDLWWSQILVCHWDYKWGRHYLVIPKAKVNSIWVCKYLWRPQEGVPDPQKLELHVVVSHQTWVLETELRSSASSILNCWGISPVLAMSFLYTMLKTFKNWLWAWSHMAVTVLKTIQCVNWMECELFLTQSS